MIECTKYTPYNKGILQGFADILIPKWGVEIKGCSLFMKDGRRWINLPSREFTDGEGKKAYAPIVRFVEKSHLDAFCEQAKKAVDDWCKKNQHDTDKMCETYTGVSRASDFGHTDLGCGEIPF